MVSKFAFQIQLVPLQRGGEAARACEALGGAVQVECIVDPELESAWFQPLNL
jgi:hypothetical protein